MGTHSQRLRLASLLAAGALAVHQLRYLIGYGHHSGEALAGQGHGYLSLVSRAVVVLAALAIIGFLGRLLKASRGPVPEPVLPRRRLWALSAGALIFMYGLQEGLEGQIERGHPSGLTGILGHGGWIAFPLAIAVAGLIVLLLRGADAAIEHTAREARRQAAPNADLRVPLPAPALSAPNPLAGHLAGRGPPLVSA